MRCLYRPLIWLGHLMLEGVPVVLVVLLVDLHRLLHLLGVHRLLVVLHHLLLLPWVRLLMLPL
jgi:hypothetical protein